MNRIYYISQGNTPQEHLENIENVCKAGCRLVQLRLKEIDNGIFFETAVKAQKICRQHETRLLINDNVLVAKQIDADGVHLGKDDLSVTEARKMLGDKIIGGTANTLEDCLDLIAQKADYIGLGPYRFTETKKKLSPILGLYGYSKIIKALNERDVKTPIFAIGGISKEDFEPLMKTGVNGVAVSGLLTKKANKELTEIIESVEKGSFFKI